MQRRTIIKRELVLSQLKATGGNVTIACKRAGVGKTQYYEWLKQSDEFRTAVEQIIFMVNKYTKCLIYTKAINGDSRSVLRLHLKSLRAIKSLQSK